MRWGSFLPPAAFPLNISETPKIMTTNNQDIIDLLCDGATRAEIAQKLGVSRTSLWRQLKAPDFKELVNSTAAVEMGVLKLQYLVAVRKIVERYCRILASETDDQAIIRLGGQLLRAGISIEDQGVK